MMTYNAPLGAPTILHKVAPIALDANGNGTATLRPVVNEYWAPFLIRVATRTPSPPESKCVVYHGGSVQDQTTYLDDTNTGSNDTSSICAGITVQYGESITAVWSGGTPNDIATLIVDGIATQYPPSVGELPRVPGTHFAGKGAGEVITQIATGNLNVVAGNNQLVAAGLDVRQFASYYLQVDLVTSTSPATGYNPVSIGLTWSNNAAGNFLMMRDFVEPFADNLNGLPISLGTLTMQDVMHGPFMSLVFQNNAASDTVNIGWHLFGTTRTVPTQRIWQQNGIDGILGSFDANLPVGGTVDLPCAISYGQAGFVFVNNSANPMNVYMGYGSLRALNDQNFIAVVAGGTGIGRSPSTQYTLPKRAAILRINPGTAGDHYSFRLITSLTKE